ncbi:MAG: adenosylcobinamide-phosphate synthase [Pseudonocardiales bacterium]|nr:cobD [Pseudonocardiales bacterium]MDT4907769.1 adenosylcobinamide-phosphate synthase [Pseudonocardiales bacterium]MDT4974121.1 adenosylcobinamide-phosphate synthase [Pseudonocardiales bacterium]
MVSRPLAAAAGIAADRLIGEPPIGPHPVALLGTLLQQIERRLYADRRSAGIVHAAIGVAIGTAAGALCRSTCLATYVAVAGRALGDAAGAIDTALSAGDLDRARALLPTLVGRDPDGLNEAEVCRAVVESVAENTVDAVVAPALWAAVAGAPGALVHRTVNTMDAMVGHRDERYSRYGWASARLDDAAAWVPARLTAALVLGCRPRAARRVVGVVRRDAPGHPSPNSGVAEAAFAAALGLRLGGESSYGGQVEVRATLGDGRPAGRDDIGRAVRLSRDVSVALACLLAVAGLAPAVPR